MANQEKNSILDFIFFNKNIITWFNFLICIIVIIVDWKFISLEYGNKFQFIISLFWFFVHFFVNFCIKIDNNTTDINNN